ncbi:MAG: protein kinase domain-containing protein [Candidatus Woesearchaeota archaeon]
MSNKISNQTIGLEDIHKENNELDEEFFKKIVDMEPWKIALKLNLLESNDGSRYLINKMFDKYSSKLQSVLGENKFKELAGVVAYSNSMLLDFESALPYALIENNKNSLVELQENSILYGRSDVVLNLDALGRKDNISELIIDSSDMQRFLIYHALPQIRLCHKKEKPYSYKLDTVMLDSILDKISTDNNSINQNSINHTACNPVNKNTDKKNLVNLALEMLDDKGNKNILRKLFFSKYAENGFLTEKYTKELKEQYLIPRNNIESLVKERAIFLNQGEVSRLQFGDENPVFPTASNIFLVNNNGEKKVWKEDLKLYTDFSRLDGYSSEKEILSDLNHTNIIKLLGTFSEKGIDFLELEYAKGKSLEEYVYISEREAIGITITLCDTLNYLHDNNIVYMDMKKKNIIYNRPKDIFGTNILSNAKNAKILNNTKKSITQSVMSPSDSDYDLETIAKNVKLLDFGMSQKKEYLDNNTTLTTLLSTPEYLSPELTGFRSQIATDTFQLGLLLHNLIYKKDAFVDSSLKLTEGDNYRESEIIMYGLSVKFGNYDKQNDSYGLLISKMLEKDPAKRPDLNYVKNELMNIYSSKFNTKNNSYAKLTEVIA